MTRTGRYARCGTPTPSWRVIRERGKTRAAVGDALSATVQPDLYLRAYGRIARNHRGADPRRDERKPWTGCPWPRSTRSSTPCASSGIAGRRSRRIVHREERLDGEASAGHSHVVGQAAARGASAPAGGVLRAAVLRALPRLPAGAWVSHRAAADRPDVARDNVVHRGGYPWLLGAIVTLPPWCR